LRKYWVMDRRRIYPDCEGKSSQSNARLAAAISPLSERKSHNVTDEVGEATDFNLSPRNRGATGWSK
jgi:hypothetical protein